MPDREQIHAQIAGLHALDADDRATIADNDKVIAVLLARNGKLYRAIATRARIIDHYLDDLLGLAR